MLTVIVLIACVMLCSACVPKTLTIPDPSIPHRVAEEAAVVIWVRRSDGVLTRERVRLMPGDWIASPQVVEVSGPNSENRDAR